MPDNLQPRITHHGLRLHANALYPPDKVRCRELLILAAGELERSRREVAAGKAEVERLAAENANLRRENTVLAREVEMSGWMMHRVAKIAARGATQ